MVHTGHYHSHAMFIRSADDFLVADGAARLDYGCRAGLNS